MTVYRKFLICLVSLVLSIATGGTEEAPPIPGSPLIRTEESTDDAEARVIIENPHPA